MIREEASQTRVECNPTSASAASATATFAFAFSGPPSAAAIRLRKATKCRKGMRILISAARCKLGLNFRHIIGYMTHKIDMVCVSHQLPYNGVRLRQRVVEHRLQNCIEQRDAARRCDLRVRREHGIHLHAQVVLTDIVPMTDVGDVYISECSSKVICISGVEAGCERSHRCDTICTVRHV